ncbi:hypothetical protein [Solirhodobacter olei]|uniref:hypothetical protein n=1 Tax=Solirhodobacter olei TaxID=2493082 RepID=UPI000FD8E0D6|nr:hypothetical protein [Solirhodobacter olei]
MPAAKPSQASVANVVSALKENGLPVVAVYVSADGSFRAEVGAYAAIAAEMEQTLDEDEPPAWGDVANDF